MRRLVGALIVIALAVTGLYIGGRALLGDSKPGHVPARCSFGTYSTDTGQASVAATMVGVVLQRGLPPRAAVLVITAAWQESKLRNVAAGSGDRDSVGVLQQRPSQGWGTEQELADVAIATERFLDALVKVSGWESEPADEVIQAVQFSADGNLYAQHEAKSTAMANALTGASPAGVSCRFDAPEQVATPTTVADLLARELPVAAPAVAASSVSVPGATWATAAWFVANADRLGIESVAYSARTWTRSDGWADSHAATTSVVATMAG
ncbi:MAG: hypothetical protein JWN61_112 [Pseudonocardiales bacterium]|nr:hypothetical protein [Pseudonocardiales bacterium]